MIDVIGMSLEECEAYFESINEKVRFVETKDIKNVYPDKRVVRLRLVGDTYEVLYTGFPKLEDTINE